MRAHSTARWLPVLAVLWFGTAGPAGIGDAALREAPLSTLTAPSRSPQAAPGGSAGSADFTITYLNTTGNDIVLPVFNNGFFGNNFTPGENPHLPSFEYPVGSKIDHIVRGGLWIGGVVEINGVKTRVVSTATVDGTAGTAVDATWSEFTPLSEALTERSTLPGGFYDPEARSEQDFLCDYTDFDETGQRPSLNALIRQETLLWGFGELKGVVFANFRIVNTGVPIDSVCVGFYAELCSTYERNKTQTTSKYLSKLISYSSDSLRLFTEHRFGDPRCDSWCGLQLLGVRGYPGLPDSILPHSTHYWVWDPDEAAQENGDSLRFERMLPENFLAPDATTRPGNWVELVSAGPLPSMGPGDTLTASFALLGGQQDVKAGITPEQDLRRRALKAKATWRADFKIALPPPSPGLAIFPEEGKIVLRWKNQPEEFIDPESRRKDFEGYRVYIGETRLDTDARLILEADRLDEVFYNTGLEAIRDSVIVEGDTFQYRYDIAGLRDGFKYWTSVTSFDDGTGTTPSLESGLAQNRTFVIPGSPAQEPESRTKVVVFPNPYRGDAAWDGSLGRDRYLWFANLPPRCVIRIYTLSGDLVDTIPFDEKGYNATEIRGIYDPTDRFHPEIDIPRLSGGMAAWDLVSKKDQGVATGLYIFSVENLDTGGKELGKFLILK